MSLTFGSLFSQVAEMIGKMIVEFDQQAALLDANLSKRRVA